MERVTTFSAYSGVVSNVMAEELRLQQVNAQVSSGKVATDLKGFGVNTQALTAAQSLLTRVNSFVQTTTTLTAKLDAQNLALTQVADAGQGARDAIANALATGSGQGLMSVLQTYFGQAVAALNTQYNGQYMFAGGRTQTPPVGSQSMSALVSTPTVPPASAWNPQPWTPNPVSTYNNVFQNDQLAPTSQLDESTSLQTGMLASDVGQNLFNAFAQIQDFQDSSGQPFSGQLTAQQTNFLTGMLRTFDAANKGMTDTVAANGLIQNRVSDAQTTQQDRATTITTMISGITDVDVASASSQLSQAQVALQASAHILSSLQNTSLLNYLSAPAVG
jgi:flagellar hook-associated protein 3 FlgL